MKVNIQIKNRWTGSVIFELETEGNTIKETLRAARKTNTDLRYTDLSNADLSNADLRYTDLSNADLSNADLSNADLRYTDLRCTDLRNTDLRCTDLRNTDLRYTDLSNADLRCTDLRNTDLRYTDLSNADLSNADLSNADLSNADLRYTDLRNAKNADLVIAQTLIVGEGDVIGWKKCRDGMIVKLLIPADAKRHNATGRKCRAEFADVLEIIDMNDKRKKPTQAISQHDSSVIYEVGKRMIPDKYDPDRFNECSRGIHFFITRIEAEQYV